MMRALYSRALVDTETWSDYLRYIFNPISTQFAFVALTGVLALSSLTAFAGERYTEVWNPPEAQTSKVKARAKVRNMVPVQTRKKHKGSVTVKKVVDKTTFAPSELSPAMSTAPGTPAKPKYAEPPLKLPPLIGPDGQVMRVGYPG
jgi:hypothetical protein